VRVVRVHLDLRRRIVLGRRPARVPTDLEVPCLGRAITEIQHASMLLRTRFDIGAAVDA
jgi:hypothetical protein